MKPWYVYMLRCADDSLYTGITTDLQRRLQQHNGEPACKGAKYTRSRRPVELVYYEQAADRSSAASREIEIKGLDKSAKLKLVNHFITTERTS